MNLAQRRKRTLFKSMYFLAVLSFVVVVIWIGLEIYFAYTNSPEEIIDPKVLEPIEVNLYLELAEELNARKKLDDQTLLEFARSHERAEITQETIVNESLREATSSAPQASESAQEQ